jgi:hypothetical protein
MGYIYVYMVVPMSVFVCRKDSAVRHLAALGLRTLSILILSVPLLPFSFILVFFELFGVLRIQNGWVFLDSNWILNTKYILVEYIFLLQAVEFSLGRALSKRCSSECVSSLGIIEI